MKTRQAFVSNSSSSSFIIISNTGLMDSDTIDKLFSDKELVIDGSQGETEFGWYGYYNNVFDRINFSYIQANYVKDTHPNWIPMLEKVIKDNTKVETIIWKMPTHPEGYAYIDHQSASYEDDTCNTEMFNSESDLTKFIFGKDSCIECGNDNDY